MFHTLINHNEDLKALVDDGYEVSIESGYLLVHSVPYVDANKNVRLGTLVSQLDLCGNKTVRPCTHIALFSGEHPCNADGNVLLHLKHNSSPQKICEKITTGHSFSSKPPEGYADYYHKMTTYVDMISRHAKALDPTVTAQTAKVVVSDGRSSVFKYIDTSSSRAGINAMADKLSGLRIDIVGVGGTGSYILDSVCKTHVKSIHIYDDDLMLQHNAFRSPGAASVRDLRNKMKKVDYFAKMYGRMRKNIHPEAMKLDQSNVGCLSGTDFVFICIDNGAAKLPIIEWLEANEIPFIDVGMGIEKIDGKLRGLLRVTASTPDKRNHVREKGRIGFAGENNNDVYSQNIQISELNALNAMMAVIKWKKLFGFYSDSENEHFTVYTIDGNLMINEDEA